MTNNTLSDLNTHLFSALNRLDNDSLTDEQIKTELNRARAVVDVGKVVVDNGRLVLDATKLKAEFQGSTVEMPALLSDSK